MNNDLGQRFTCIIMIRVIGPMIPWHQRSAFSLRARACVCCVLVCNVRVCVSVCNVCVCA